MVAKDLAQGLVQDMGCCVVAGGRQASRAIDGQGDCITGRNAALFDNRSMEEQALRGLGRVSRRAVHRSVR